MKDSTIHRLQSLCKNQPRLVTQKMLHRVPHTRSSLHQRAALHKPLGILQEGEIKAFYHLYQLLFMLPRHNTWLKGRNAYTGNHGKPGKPCHKREGTGAQPGSQQVRLHQQPESRLNSKRGGAIGPQGLLQGLASSSKPSPPEGSTALLKVLPAGDPMSKHVILLGEGGDFTFKA